MRGRHLALACLFCLASCGYPAFLWWRYHSPEQQLKRAEAAIRSGQLGAALPLASKLEHESAYELHACLLRGQVMLKAGRFEEALNELNRVGAEGNLGAQAAALIGECLVKLGRPAEAERALRFAVDRLPDHADAHRWLATIYFDSGFMSGAIGHLEIVARLDSADGRPHRLMGLIYKDFQQHALGIQAYKESLRRNPQAADVAQIALELADLQEAQRDYAAALETLHRFVAARSHNATALALEATCLLAAGQQEEAVRLLDQSLSLKPSEVRALRLRGKLCLEAGELTAAVPLLERAVEIDRHDYQSHYQLALAYGQLRDQARAEDHWKAMKESQGFMEKLSALNKRVFESPSDPEVRYELGSLCETMGRRDMAIMWLKAALAWDPNHEQARAALDKLR